MLWKKDCNKLRSIPGASEWRVCVRSEEKKKRILNSCHGGAAGGHFERVKILEKIWRNMVEEI